MEKINPFNQMEAEAANTLKQELMKKYPRRNILSILDNSLGLGIASFLTSQAAFIAKGLLTKNISILDIVTIYTGIPTLTFCCQELIMRPQKYKHDIGEYTKSEFHIDPRQI